MGSGVGWRAGIIARGRPYAGRRASCLMKRISAIKELNWLINAGMFAQVARPGRKPKEIRK